MTTQESTVFTTLVQMYPQAKKTTLREMLSSRRVLLNGAVAKSLKQPVGEKDKVEVLDFADTPVKTTTLSDGLKLVHFDAELVVVDKPSGLITSSDPEERRPTVWRLLGNFYKKQNNKNQVHLIHRLDKDASGLLVFARTWDAYASLKQQFFEHTITRQYDVIVHGIPKEKKGKLEHLLLENEHTGEVKVTKDIKAGKLAIMDYEVLETDKGRNLSHLKCTLFTGRKHQIRVQLKALGHPVCADPMYGKGDEPPGRLALHASHLTLTHPGSKKKVSFESRMPGSFLHLFR